jgi:hypothetical protein
MRTIDLRSMAAIALDHTGLTCEVLSHVGIKHWLAGPGEMRP